MKCVCWSSSTCSIPACADKIQTWCHLYWIRMCYNPICNLTHFKLSMPLQNLVDLLYSWSAQYAQPTLTQFTTSIHPNHFGSMYTPYMSSADAASFISLPRQWPACCLHIDCRMVCLPTSWPYSTYHLSNILHSPVILPLDIPSQALIIYKNEDLLWEEDSSLWAEFTVAKCVL